ncbi:MAG: hypothetical protein ACT4NP_18640 [Pseudonocardiales bacterium]
MAVPDSLPNTRDALHRLAEHVLAASRYAATGHIGLVPAPGGFATPPYGPDSTVLAVDLDELVVTRAGQQRRTRIRTVGQAADFAGVQPGAPEQVYRPVTPLAPDAVLQIDREAARLLADWYQLGAHALAAFAAAVPDDQPTPAQLWPEHFDLGITAARINYGVSPGDAAMPEPYLYIGPFDTPPPDEFWNAPFGAALGHREVASVEAAVAFFHDGRARAARVRTQQRSTS